VYEEQRMAAFIIEPRPTITISRSLTRVREWCASRSITPTTFTWSLDGDMKPRVCVEFDEEQEIREFMGAFPSAQSVSVCPKLPFSAKAS
jgi:hypothetical protein